MGLCGLLFTSVVTAQTSFEPAPLIADSARANQQPSTTLPLPGEGVFYLRMGKPGGVTINSRRHTRSGYFPEDQSPIDSLEIQSPGESPAIATPPLISPPAPVVIQREGSAPPLPQQGPAVEIPGWTDLRDMERYLLEQMNARFDAVLQAQLSEMDDTEAYLIERMDNRFNHLQADLDALKALATSMQSQVVVPVPNGNMPLQLPTPVVTTDRLTPDETESQEIPVNQPSGVTLPIVERVEHAMLETGVFLALSVNFEFGQNVLLPSSTPTLDAVAEVLEKYPELRIEVAGHTDTTGPIAVNQTLSENRAAAVREYVLGAHPSIDPSRLVSKGYGSSRPIASNERPTGRMLNRRVEFVVLNPEATERYTRERVLRPGNAPGTEDEMRRLLRQILEEELQNFNTPPPDSIR